MEIIQNKTNIYALLSFLVLAISGYTMQIVVNYGFGVEGLGEFNSALAYFLIASLVTTLGSNFGVLSFASNPKNKKFQIQCLILFKAFKLTMIGFLIVFIFTVLIVEFFRINYLRNNFSLIYLSVGTLFFGLNKVLLSFMNAKNLMSKYYLLQALRYIVMFLFTLYFVFYYGKIESLSFVFILTEMSLLLIIVFLTFKKEYFINFRKLKELKNQEIVNFNIHSLKSLPGGVIQELAVRVDIMMLSLMSSSKSVGYYSVAAMIAEGMNQLLVVWRDSLIPIFAYNIHHSQGMIKVVLNKILSNSVINFSILLVLSFFLYEYVLHYLFGESIVNHSLTPFRILAFGLFLSTPFTVLQLLPNQIGKPEIISYVTLLSLIVNVSCNYWFIPKWGMNGAAIATSISWFVGSASLLWWIFLTPSLDKK